jgi:hypothetical protein
MVSLNQDLQARLCNQSLAIRTFPITPVQNIVNNFKLDKIDSVEHFKSNITNWLKPVVDLSSFEFLYPVNGITDCLNYWMWQEKRKIKIKKDDYAWVTGFDDGEVMYVSCPSSIDGNYCEIPRDIPVVLDLAYVGSSKFKKIDIPSNVEKVFFSLSKSFGVRNYRIGYYWSRTPDEKLGPLIEHGKYYNYHSHKLGEQLIDQINIDEVYNTLFRYQLDICTELNLTPSDAVWLATSNDSMYGKFFRNYTNRICIADLIKEKYNERFKNLR